jgi:predicted helicase
MSSLVSYASPWINEESNLGRKRIPTMSRNKTIKMKPFLKGEGEPDEYAGRENFQSLEPSTIDDAKASNSDRSARVNELLNKITTADSEADSSKLGSFNPINPPSVSVKKDMVDANADSPKYNPAMMSRPTASNYNANEGPSSNLSNYMRSYEPPVKLPPPSYQNQNGPYYAKMGLGAGTLDEKIMEKINYMIHMLEEQHNEKTSNITEEFLLYTFLGVFIIFLVDSFARSGTYKR